MGTFLHPAKEFIVCQSTNQKIPKFNTPIYLENKTQIGKVDEVFGPINSVVRAAACAPILRAATRRPRARRACVLRRVRELTRRARCFSICFSICFSMMLLLLRSWIDSTLR